MIEDKRYRIEKEIYRGKRISLFKAVREADNCPLIIKKLNNVPPSQIEISRLAGEFEILKKLSFDGVPRPISIEKKGGRYLLLFEDGRDSISLKEVIENQPMEVGRFLEMALNITGILKKIHEAGVIHKDIKPRNILFFPGTEEIQIIDFGLSSQLLAEEQEMTGAGGVQGTLAYISPEQTGRMNRSVDHRSDLYSLGVTFFEMLTGTLPFKAATPLNWIHCHMAKEIPFASNVNSNIPRPLSSIIAKLMAKNPEDRYQETLGLFKDLEICIQRWKEKGKIENFEEGRFDISRRFHISQKLFGREREIGLLMEAFERAATGNREMMTVSGYAGVGKSRLVHEVHKPIVEKRGYFILGKFDQIKGDIPYSPFVQAFKELIRQLLTETSEELVCWREELSKACGDNIQAIIEVIPQLEKVVGKKPPLPSLKPLEAQNRFNSVFQAFVGVFTKREHPLVLFIDDLQWADLPTLDLLKLLLTEKNEKCLLFIGAYRNNEVDEAHPLLHSIDAMRKEGVLLHELTLKPLENNHCKQLIAETLRRPVPQVAPLARLVMEKTGGNPFFINELLKNLYNEKGLRFDTTEGGWVWDMKKIRNLFIPGNVVDLMIAKLKRLPSSTQNLIRLGALIGNTFDLESLSIIARESPAETARILWPAVREGFLMPLGEGHKLLYEGGDSLSEKEVFSLSRSSDRFVHDRIQQAAYSLIHKQEREAYHLRIGTLLLKKLGKEGLKERLFEVVEHLNKAKNLIDDEEERVRLSRLNLKAGIKSKESNAYSAAYSYFTAAISLLGEGGWQYHYALTRDLFREGAEAAYQSRRLEDMERLTSVLLEKAECPLDRSQAFMIQITAKVGYQKLPEAIDLALRALDDLGVPLPADPDDRDIGIALKELEEAVGKRSADDLLDLPLLEDKTIMEAVALLLTIFPLAYLSRPRLLPIVIFKMTFLSVTRGNGPHAPAAYVNYAAIVCSVPGRMEEGHQYGLMALQLKDRLRARTVEGFVHFCYGSLIQHWKERLRNCEVNLEEGRRKALDVGDFSTAGYTLYLTYWHGFFFGETLRTIEIEYGKHIETAAKLQQFQVVNAQKLMEQMVLGLRGKSDNPLLLVGPHFDEKEYEALVKAGQEYSGLFVFYHLKAYIHYLFGEYQKALSFFEKGEAHLQSIVGQYVITEFHHYYSLTLLALYEERTPGEQEKILERVGSNQEKMALWSEQAPMNHRCKYLLVEAETKRVLAKIMESIPLYGEAIEEARENGFIQHQALANELCGRLWKGRGQKRIASIYLFEALSLYRHWGAKAKVRQMETLEGKLLHFAFSPPSREPGAESGTTTTGTSDSLDLETIIKASQALSGEIELEKLIKRLMTIIIENAGAERAFLVLKDSVTGKFRVEAAVDGVGKEVALLPSVILEDQKEFSVGAVLYSARTEDYIVIDDASKDHRFEQDPYVVEKNPKSLLCAPLINQGRLLGVIYMENNLSPSVFSFKRLDPIKIIVSHAAVSLENALLYRERQLADQERDNLQKQLTTAQKMESIGRLAGGIAHDFNNILSAINGFSELALMDMEEGNPLRSNVRAIFEAGQKGTTLTRQLLAFSKKQLIKPRILNLNDTIEGIEAILRKFIGENIQFRLLTGMGLWNVEADPSQIEQVLCNLIINAKDAMPEGGTVTLMTSNKTVDSHRKGEFIGMDPGQWVELQISDTGVGMSREVKEHIFEPFFTTKENKGTGLGLATVYGVVKQNRGFIFVDSQPGLGTSFQIFFPRSKRKRTPQVMEPHFEVHRGTETILLVEDEEEVRKVIHSMLKKMGYGVVEASNGHKALQYVRMNPQEIDLVLTDVVMPGMNGKELAESIKRISHKIKIVFMSGYTDDNLDYLELSKKNIRVLEKPLTIRELAHAMRSALDADKIYD